MNNILENTLVANYVKHLEQRSIEFVNNKQVSIFDMILFAILPTNKGNVFKINNPLQHWLFAGLIPESIKINQILSISKLNHSLSFEFKKMASQNYLSSSGLGQLVISKEFGIWLTNVVSSTLIFETKDNKMEVNISSGKQIISDYINVIEVIEKAPMDDPLVLERFFESGNFDLFVEVTSIIECLGNYDFDLLENIMLYSNKFIYSEIRKRWQRILHKIGTGLTNSQNVSKLLSQGIRILFNKTCLIEEIGDKYIKSSVSQGYGRLRVGFIFQTLGIFLFLYLFLKQDEDKKIFFDLHSEITEHKKQKYLEKINLNKKEREYFYSKIFLSQMFYESREARIKNKHSDQFEVDEDLRLNKFNCLTWKCLLLLDDELQALFPKMFDQYLDSISYIEQKMDRFLSRGMYFFIEILFGETNFEEFYTSFACLIEERNKKINYDYLSLSIKQKMRIFCKLNKIISFNNMIQKFTIPFQEFSKKKITKKLKTIAKSFLNINEETEKCTLLHSTPCPDIVVQPNLFFTEEKQLNSIVVKENNQNTEKRKIDDVYFSQNSKINSIISLPIVKKIMEKLILLCKDTFTKESEDKENNSFRLKLLDFVFLFCRLCNQFTPKNNDLSELVDLAFKDMTKKQKHLINELFFKNKSVLKINNDSKEKKTKLKASRLLQKIKRKQKKTFKKLSLKKELEVSKIENHCFSCQGVFDSKEDVYILSSIHKYNTEKLFVKGKTDFFSSKSFMLTSCGHKYHYSCLKNIINFNQIQCVFCKRKFDILVPLKKPNDLFERSKYFAHNMNKGNELFNQLISKHTYNEKSRLGTWGMILGVVEQAFRLFKTIMNKRFERNILPCAKALLTNMYFLKITQTNLFQKLTQESKILRHTMGDLFSENFNIKNIKLNLSRVCIESLFVRSLLLFQVDSIQEIEDQILGEEFCLEIILSLLESNFELLFPKMIICKLLQTGVRDWGECLNLDVIVSRCYDLLCTGHLLLKLCDPTVEEVFLPESIAQIKKGRCASQFNHQNCLIALT